VFPQMNGRFLILTVGALLTVSCADLMKIPTIMPKAKKSSRFSDGDATSGLGGIGGVAGAKMGNPDEGFQAGKTPEKAGFLPTTVEKGTVVDGTELPSDEQIVWSSDDPDAELSFDQAFEKAVKPKSPWLENYQEARRDSMRRGKPILMYFTSSKNLSSSAAIQRELFAAHDFGDWAKENIVRLRIDIDGGSLERGTLSESTTIKRRNYAEKLRKQFHVLGYPSVVLLQPDGSVYTHERGYRRGKKAELWGTLKNAVLTIEHNHLIWKRSMEAKGYRDWTGKKGEVVFAKLARYYKGDITLIEPDGNRVKTSTIGLSDKDRGWILAEKAKRDQRVKD